jgi:hypothetical protein
MTQSRCGISFRTNQERQIFGLLPHNLPSDPAGRVFHNSRERLGYLKREVPRHLVPKLQWRQQELFQLALPQQFLGLFAGINRRKIRSVGIGRRLLHS